MEKRRETLAFGDLRVTLETVADFDALLEHYARDAADDVSRIPYFAALWPAARALAAYLATRDAPPPGQRVIELGCGLGLPALVCALQGAQVTAVDFHPDNEPLFRRNLALNQVTAAYHNCRWDRLPPALHRSFDLVLGSDLVYEADQPASLAAAMTCLCAPDGCIVLSDPGRKHLAALEHALAGHGFTPELEPHGDIYIIVFRRPGPA